MIVAAVFFLVVLTEQVNGTNGHRVTMLAVLAVESALKSNIMLG